MHSDCINSMANGAPMPRTIVLAYSGGLDTSIIVPWLREHYGARVICVAADIGQGDQELAGLRAKALASGAEECYVEDLRTEFVRDFIFPTLRAGAVYNRKYLLGTSMARPLIARRQVEIARKVGADALAHGCTGKGNDQVRFELTYATFAPDLPVIAPWREWDIRSRDDALAYAAERGIPVAATREKIYSRDRNLWHLSHEGGVLKDLIAPRYADLVYEGRWWTTEREAYDAFVNATQERVTGHVTLRLYKGNVTVAGRSSAHALYDERFVTFGEDDVYEQADAAGFIRLFALPARVRAIRDLEA